MGNGPSGPSALARWNINEVLFLLAGQSSWIPYVCTQYREGIENFLVTQPNADIPNAGIGPGFFRSRSEPTLSDGPLLSPVSSSYSTTREGISW